MRRGLLGAAALLPLAHGILLLASGPQALKIAIVLGTDLAALALVALAARQGKGKPAAAEPAPAPELPHEPEARLSAEPGSAALELAGERESAAARLRKIGGIAEKCLATADKVFGEEAREAVARLEGAGAAVSELSGAVSAARQGADLLRENTDKIFEIANNLANSAEQAFNLAHEVETRASAMTGDLAASLAETESLTAESKKISDILTIMSEIASTTSILSFNASIVAANAGGAGKPFAVVAKEMRKLSDSTETSLKDITTIVRNIQERVEKVAVKIRLVNEGVKDEKESLVAVAGNLQGVMLANEVVRTVSGLCVQKAAEELDSFRSMEGKIGSARQALASDSGSKGAAELSEGLHMVVELAEKRA